MKIFKHTNVIKDLYEKNAEWHTTSYVADSLNASSPNGLKRLLSYVEVKIILELGHFIVMVEHIRIDSLDRANVLNHHFSSVFINEEDASYLPTVHDHDIPTMYSITISSVRLVLKICLNHLRPQVQMTFQLTY